MKQVVLFVIVVLLGLCIVSAMPASAAVVYTSDFNTDTNSDGIANGWSALSGSAGSTFWLETIEKMEGTASQGCLPVPWKGIMSDPISAIASGQTYTIKYWIAKLRGSILEIWGDGKLDSYYTTAGSSYGWAYIQDLVTASSNVNPAQIAIDGHAAGAGFTVDYMKIEEGDTRVTLGTLSGEIELQGFGGDLELKPVRIVLTPHEAGGTEWNEVFNLTSNPGTYSITLAPIVPGTYDVAFSAGGFLRKVFYDVVFTSGANVLDVQLINGDVDGDNVLSIGDAGITLWNENMEGD